MRERKNNGGVIVYVDSSRNGNFETVVVFIVHLFPVILGLIVLVSLLLQSYCPMNFAIRNVSAFPIRWFSSLLISWKITIWPFKYANHASLVAFNAFDSGDNSFLWNYRPWAESSPSGPMFSPSNPALLSLPAIFLWHTYAYNASVHSNHEAFQLCSLSSSNISFFWRSLNAFSPGFHLLSYFWSFFPRWYCLHG